MKLALATLLLASVASLPRANARIGPKAKAIREDPHKAHLAQKAILQNTTEHRIIGGDAAEQGEFPFYVKWLGEYLCGGSLIHEDIILTAAHCQVVTTDSVSIGAYFLYEDDANAENRQIETRMVHPNYDADDSFVNDVMVLKITSPSLLPTIPLNNDSASPSDSEGVTVIGLGHTDDADTFPDSLRKLTIQAVAHEKCAADWAFMGENIYEDVMLCASVQEGDKASCQGDSGGPLLELRDGQYVQVGITSWGIEGCASPNAPNIYTRVSGAKDWIDQMICELSGNPPASCNGDDPAPPTPPADCENVPGWYDSDGPEYDCAWYEEQNACEFALEYENFGYTAIEACCYCGGGNA